MNPAHRAASTRVFAGNTPAGPLTPELQRPELHYVAAGEPGDPELPPAVAGTIGDAEAIAARSRRHARRQRIHDRADRLAAALLTQHYGTNGVVHPIYEQPSKDDQLAQRAYQLALAIEGARDDFERGTQCTR